MSFGLNLFGTVCASWTYMSISFIKLGKFSFIIFSNKFSISCSSSSPSGIPVIWTLAFLQMSQSSYSLLIVLNSCFFILFWLTVYFFLMFQFIDMNPGFLPFTVGSCGLFFVSLNVAFISYAFAILSEISEHPSYQCFKLCT